MSIVIRAAICQDATAIARLIEQVFGDDAHPQQIAAVLAEDDHATFAAYQGNAVVGFVDGFLTLDQNGQRRWELDLLAVGAGARGQGVGKALIRQSTNAGSDFGAELSRALVAVGNAPMHAAMRSEGYQTQAAAYGLFTSTQAGVAMAATRGKGYLLPVNTLTYRGIWLEGEISHVALQQALVVRAKHQLDIVGAVVSLTSGDVQVVQAARFDLVGHYQWWHKAL